jgi:RNA polymerase sigma-70 factor (ECF subfamily)
MTTIADLWRDRHADLRRYVRRRVSDHHDAEDIVQDVFVRAQELLHQLESVDRAGAWLSRIAANRIVDHYRSRRPTEELPEDLAAEAPEDDPVIALAPCLPQMIEQLPQTYRDAVRLSEIDGIAQRVVAQRLALSVSGAKSRVQRGRSLLRQLVEKCCRVLVAGQSIVGFERIAQRCACSQHDGGNALRPS